MEPINSLFAGIAALNAFGLVATRLTLRRAYGLLTDAAGCVFAMLPDIRPVRDAGRFLAAWLRAPLRVAAVAPSGRALSRLMTAELSGSTGPVVELGPGTGSFTRAMIANGVRQADIALIEYGQEFSALLAARFPHAQIRCMDAANLGTVDLFAGRPFGAVVSGLPLLSMPRRQVVAILKGCFDRLEPEGALYQFTYGPRCPVPKSMMDRLGLEAERIGGTLANIPPAAVYRIRRRRQGTHNAGSA
jgi:phosphatidylethanolamine/phosphatidyl-N-methylethanolamine N-methyltransferase